MPHVDFTYLSTKLRAPSALTPAPPASNALLRHALSDSYPQSSPGRKPRLPQHDIAW
jgi:hypothetical protein